MVFMKKILLSFFLLIILVSCRKDPVMIKSGIETRVFGKLTDFHDEPISNLKIKVAEFKATNSGGLFMSVENLEFVDWIDSTYTNTDGRYDFVFKTTGNGNFYRLFFGERTKENEPQIIWDPFYVDITNGAHDMKYIGKEFEFNTINLVELYPCQVTLKVNNLETFPMTLSHSLTYFFNLKNIETNGTSIHTIYINKYNDQTLTVLRRKNGISQQALYKFPASNTEGITYQTITVEEADFKDVK